MLGWLEGRGSSADSSWNHSNAAAAQLPNGEVTSDQLRYLASVLEPYGEDGCGDITTRANLQVRELRPLSASLHVACFALPVYLLVCHVPVYPYKILVCPPPSHRSCAVSSWRMPTGLWPASSRGA